MGSAYEAELICLAWYFSCATQMPLGVVKGDDLTVHGDGVVRPMLTGYRRPSRVTVICLVASSTVAIFAHPGCVTTQQQ